MHTVYMKHMRSSVGGSASGSDAIGEFPDAFLFGLRRRLTFPNKDLVSTSSLYKLLLPLRNILC